MRGTKVQTRVIGRNFSEVTDALRPGQSIIVTKFGKDHVKSTSTRPHREAPNLAAKVLATGGDIKRNQAIMRRIAQGE